MLEGDSVDSHFCPTYCKESSHVDLPPRFPCRLLDPGRSPLRLQFDTQLDNLTRPDQADSINHPRTHWSSSFAHVSHQRIQGWGGTNRQSMVVRSNFYDRRHTHFGGDTSQDIRITSRRCGSDQRDGGDSIIQFKGRGNVRVFQGGGVGERGRGFTPRVFQNQACLPSSDIF